MPVFCISKKKIEVHFLKFSILQINAKKKFHQFDPRNIKLPDITKNGILINFYLHGRLSKSDIFGVKFFANSWICNLYNSAYKGLMRVDHGDQSCL